MFTFSFFPRRGCRIDPSDDDLEHGSVPLVAPPIGNNGAPLNLTSAQGSDDSSQDVISCTPDIANILANNSSCPSSSSDGDQDSNMNSSNGLLGGAGGAGNRAGSPLEIMEVISPKRPRLGNGSGGGALKANGGGLSKLLPGGFSAGGPPCSQCTLCSMVLPTAGFLMHLRDYHRVT